MMDTALADETGETVLAPGLSLLSSDGEVVPEIDLRLTLAPEHSELLGLNLPSVGRSELCMKTRELENGEV